MGRAASYDVLLIIVDSLGAIADHSLCVYESGEGNRGSGQKRLMQPRLVILRERRHRLVCDLTWEPISY